MLTRNRNIGIKRTDYQQQNVKLSHNWNQIVGEKATVDKFERKVGADENQGVTGV